MATYYGVDVCSDDGFISWKDVKEDGKVFAILRVTQKYGIDERFILNYDSAKAAGLKVGVYKYSYATSAEKSKEEAEYIVSTLNGRSLDFPVFLDLEWQTQEKYSKSKLNDIIEAFMSVIIAAGYKVGIYCNKNWYNNLLPDSVKKKYDFWIASVPNTQNDNGTIRETLRPSYGVGWQYSWKGSVKGISRPCDMDVFYTDYSGSSEKEDEKPTETKTGVTASDVVQVAEGWLGRKESDGSHKAIIDIYNSHKPLARGYKLQYTDSWCDAFVSAVFISLSATDLIGGTECGVEEHVKKFKAAGIWEEDGTITPSPADIIVYNWDKASQPNDGYSDHIGIVKSVSGNTIKAIEGNYKDSVAIREVKVGNGYIRGYARPKYAKASNTVTKPATDTKTETASTPKSHTIIKQGSTGSEVKFLQTALNHLGYNLATDGIFGFKTYTAVTHFQYTHGLVVDGIVGPKTWEALDKALTNILAKEVIAGKWGNQPDREKNLAAAGFTNYQEIQNEVNNLLKR